VQFDAAFERKRMPTATMAQGLSIQMKNVQLTCTYITNPQAQYLKSSGKIVSADFEISNVANIEAIVDQRVLNAIKRPGQILQTQLCGNEITWLHGRKKKINKPSSKPKYDIAWISNLLVQYTIFDKAVRTESVRFVVDILVMKHAPKTALIDQIQR
jgi:hypothetical protein